jgi:hypothetical protein
MTNSRKITLLLKKPTVYMKFLVANKFSDIFLHSIAFLHDTSTECWGMMPPKLKGWNAVGLSRIYNLEQLLWFVRMDYCHSFFLPCDQHTIFSLSLLPPEEAKRKQAHIPYFTTGCSFVSCTFSTRGFSHFFLWCHTYPQPWVMALLFTFSFQKTALP